jgi:hypothetical protein
MYKLYGSSSRWISNNGSDTAYKYAGVDAEVQIILKRNKLIVRDNSNSIDEEILPQIFDEFFSGNKCSADIRLSLDLFRNSTPSLNCCVAPVLRSSCT